MDTEAKTDALQEAHEAIKKAIEELRQLGHEIPLSLHRAARHLYYLVEDDRLS